MGYYGIQPDGRVRIAGGQLWNPNDPLPPEMADGFNATPNGNPLIPSSLPRLSPTMPNMAASNPTPAALAAPSGYAGSPAGGSFAPDASQPQSASWLDQILKANSLPTSADLQAPPPSAPRGMFGAQPAKPSFFGEGGTGRTIAGIVGDALLAANNRPMIYAPLREKQMEFAKSAFQQQQEGLRQMMLAQYKVDHPEPGSVEKNYRFLSGLNPLYGDSYARAESNPMTLMTDPVSGAVGFYPKGGYQPTASTPPVRVKSKADVDALPSGTQFMAPDGTIKVKP